MPPSIPLETAHSNALRSGILGVTSSDRALTGVITGFSKFRPLHSLGDCEIVCRSLSLWGFVAETFGFRVSAIHNLPARLVPVMQSLFPGALVSLPGQRRRRPGSVRAVFGDFASVPSGDKPYWISSRCTHFFSISPSDMVAPPTPDWILLRHSFQHWELGGCTDGVFEIGVLARACDLTGVLAPLPRLELPWNPFDTVLGAREFCTPVPNAPLLSSERRPVVHWRAGGHAAVGSWGLFPSGSSSERVLVPSPFSPSGWGLRILSARELATLHDVPILVQDRFEQLGKTRDLTAFFAAVPAKVLSNGLDLLISNYFRGVLISGVVGTRRQ